MKINSEKQAFEILSQGQTVAFGTETVYGLGANAFNDDAVAKIFAIKGRPTINPLIWHCASISKAKCFADISEETERLLSTFWPGPLTAIVPTNCKNGLLARAGLSSVAIRMPKHPLALKMLEMCEFPVAAPSANPSGKLSPTCYDHVVRDYKNHDLAPDAIWDTGSCTLGLESTIIDMTEAKPSICRHGSITNAVLNDHFGYKISTFHSNKSPGTRFKHYAPNKPLRINANSSSDKNEVFIGFGNNVSGEWNLSKKACLTEACANLYTLLRRADIDDRFNSIAVCSLPVNGIGEAINDRLSRACSK